MGCGLFSYVNIAISQEESYWIDLRLNPEVYVLHGDTLTVSVAGNFSVCEIQFWNDGNLFGSVSQNVNSSRDFTIFDSYPYGEYIVKAVVGDSVVSCFLTVLDISGWEPVSFPFERTHKNVDYTFFINGTLFASQDGEVLSIDLSMIRTLINLYDLDVSASVNSMNFRIHLSKAGVLDLNIIFSFVHVGCKFIVYGELDQDRQFVFNIGNPERLRNLVDCVKQGNLVFDFSDLRKASNVFSYNNGVLVLSLPKTFSFDPVIFSDGFESGDFSEWSGAASSGTAPSVETDNPHHGTYNAQASMPGDNNGEYSRFYKDLGDNYKTVYLRQYLQFSALPNATGKTFTIAVHRDVEDYTNRLSLDIEHDGTSAKWKIWRDGTTDWGGTVEIDTWYCVESATYFAASDGWSKLWIDGDLECEVTGKTNDDSCGYVYLGIYGSDWVSAWATDVYIDCVVVNGSYVGIEVGDSVSPTYSGLTYSSTSAGSSNTLNCSMNDETALDSDGQWIFGRNFTIGSWEWSSEANFTSTPETVSSVVSIGSGYAGYTGSFMWNFTDHAGNSNSTGVQTFLITAAPEYAERGELLAAVVVGAFILVPIICLIVLVASRRR